MAVPYHTHSFEIPSATKVEVEAGVRTDVAATPASLGSAASKDASYFATANQGALADTAVRPTLKLVAGDGLTGGGTLAANRIFALSSTSLASLALADAAVQTINGKSGRAITLSSEDVGAVPIARETEIIANTYARHTHSNKAVLDATTAAFTTAMSSKLAGIPADADKTPGIATVTNDGLMSSGDKTKLNGIAAGATANTGTVTSVAVTVPAGLAVAGAPITTAGTFAISYAAGYRGYTTAEANKLAGIPADADKTPALAAVATSGNYADLNGKPTLGSLAAKNNIAVADISAAGIPSAATFLRGDGTWGTVAGAGTVTSVGLSAPTGFSVSGSPVTGSGTLTIAYVSGYQGYTTAEANKLAGIPADADKTPALAAVATTGSYGDLSNKPATFPPSAHTHTPSEVGLGNVANKSEAQMVASGAIADSINGKITGDACEIGGFISLNAQAPYMRHKSSDEVVRLLRYDQPSNGSHSVNGIQIRTGRQEVSFNAQGDATISFSPFPNYLSAVVVSPALRWDFGVTYGAEPATVGSFNLRCNYPNSTRWISWIAIGG
ncbi:hypothetical protein HBA91_01060 [Ochrobactrum sp. MR34]|nr:hypothetical protein [Ochrobactrum sp. MR34]